MVVSQDSNVDIDTTYSSTNLELPLKMYTDNDKKDTENIIEENLNEEKVNITTSEDSDVNEEFVTTELLTESSPTTHNLEVSPGVESGLQIQFTSLKLTRFPIIESNLSSSAKIVESIHLNTINIGIGDEVIYNVDIKIHSYPKFKMLELKTREFKLALSCILTSNNTLIADGNGYFSYEIFSKIKNSRLFNIIKLFQKVFSGGNILFTINDLKANISVDNRLQYHKFIIMENALNIYIKISKDLRLNKTKNFSESQIEFYTLYLLDEILKGKNTIDSWINFSIENNDNFKVGDFINFVRIHDIGIREVNFKLKETIEIKSPLSETEITKNKIACYKKNVQIKLEKIMK